MASKRSRRPPLVLGPDQRLRLVWIMGSLAMVLVVLWLSRLTLEPPETLAEEVMRYRQIRELTSTRGRPLRGNILDTCGRPLTINGFHYVLVAYVDKLEGSKEEREHKAQVLARVLGYSENEIRACLEPYIVDESGNREPRYYCLLKNDVDKEEKARLTAALKRSLTGGGDRELPDWLGFESFPVRLHPEGKLASHVLGTYLPLSDVALGVELTYDDYLSGEAKPLETWFIGKTRHPLVSMSDGCSLILTINREVQRATEEVLKKTIRNSGANGGSIIVVDVNTGEILAMAGYPDFDPDAPLDSVDQRVLDNPAVTRLYEPGSVFKLVTYAAAIDSGLITAQSPFYDEGYIIVGGNRIRNFQGAVYGDVTATQALIYSINVVATKINLLMGEEVFYSYVRRFGFDARTGIDLPGEPEPLVRFPGESGWTLSDLGTNSFGQGISVTPLHMAMAIAAIANRGLLMKPHVVSEIVCDGKAYRVPVENFRVRQVISPQSAETLKQMMVEVVDFWHNYAGVPGYSAAGKTGTAEIPVGGVYQGTIASFGGFVPASNPAIAILVKIDRPRVAITGLEIAAPAFSELASRVLPILGVAPDRPEELAPGR